MIKLFIVPQVAMSHQQGCNEPVKQVWQKAYVNSIQIRKLVQILHITTYFHNIMTNKSYSHSYILLLYCEWQLIPCEVWLLSFGSFLLNSLRQHTQCYSMAQMWYLSQEEKRISCHFVTFPLQRNMEVPIVNFDFQDFPHIINLFRAVINLESCEGEFIYYRKPVRLLKLFSLSWSKSSKSSPSLS
jgi:hypothetical protein